MPPDIADFRDLNAIFSNVISLALTACGLALLVMLVIGGFQFLTAGGDKEATQKAQRTLTYALAGLLLALSAWIIVNLLGNFFGLDLSHFSICFPGKENC